MSICYTGSNRLVCALSFDSQLSCVFYLLNVFQFSQMFSLFPLLLIASSIFPALLDPPRKNDTLNQYIDDAREQTNLRPGQPPETNLPGCRTSPVDLAKPWEHLKPTCFAAARTSNMSLHTSGHVVAPKADCLRATMHQKAAP